MTVTATHAPAVFWMTPARWVALAIGLPLVLSLIAFSAFDLVAQFGQASFPVSIPVIPVQHGHLSVSTGGGNVTVHPAGDGPPRLTGTARYSLVRPEVGTSPTGVTFRCRLYLGNCGLNATLTVPPADALTLSSGGGDMTVSGLRNGADLSSGGGNVSVQGVGGSVVVSTGGGDLNADGLAGPLRFSTDGGNLTGTTLTSQTVDARSYGGDVRLIFATAPKHLVIESYGGNITVVLPHTPARYNIDYSTGGGNGGVERDLINPQSGNYVSATSDGGDIRIIGLG